MMKLSYAVSVVVVTALLLSLIAPFDLIWHIRDRVNRSNSATSTQSEIDEPNTTSTVAGGLEILARNTTRNNSQLEVEITQQMNFNKKLQEATIEPNGEASLTIANEDAQILHLTERAILATKYARSSNDRTNKPQTKNIAFQDSKSIHFSKQQYRKQGRRRSRNLVRKNPKGSPKLERDDDNEEEDDDVDDKNDGDNDGGYEDVDPDSQDEVEVEVEEGITFVYDTDLTVACPTGGIEEMSPYKQTGHKLLSLTFSYHFGIGITQSSVPQDGNRHRIVKDADVDVDDGIDSSLWDSVYIVTTTSNRNKILFAGLVLQGGSFKVAGAKDKLDKETNILIFENEFAYLDELSESLQEIQIDTSLDTPLSTQDQFGSVIVESATLSGGIVLGRVLLEEGSITYSLGGGEEAAVALFRIDENTGIINFIDAPDYESPRLNGSNKYLLTVMAKPKIGSANIDRCTEGSTSRLQLQIEVTNRNEIRIADGTNPSMPTDLVVECTQIIGSPPADICMFKSSDGDKPAKIKFIYNFNTGIQQSINGDNHFVETMIVDFPTNAALYDKVRIVVTDKNGRIQHDDVVSRDDVFEISGTKDDGSFETETEFELYSLEEGNSKLLQRVGIHTSCSDPTSTADRFGSITIAGAVLQSSNTIGGTIRKSYAGSQLIYNLDREDKHLFQVDSFGIMTFKTTPDSSFPDDADGNNEYLVAVEGTASDCNKTSRKIFVIRVDTRSTPRDSPRSLSPTPLPSTSRHPSESPSNTPSFSRDPSPKPSVSTNPSIFSPSLSEFPSVSPSKLPSFSPSVQPSNPLGSSRSSIPSAYPSLQPSNNPSLSQEPSYEPSAEPTVAPALSPTLSPTVGSTVGRATSNPTMRPLSKRPSFSFDPSNSPSSFPSFSKQESKDPSTSPSSSSHPSNSPSTPPSLSLEPSNDPSTNPSSSSYPSSSPSAPPSLSLEPSNDPSTNPSSSSYPSSSPSAPPSLSLEPSKTPSTQPSASFYPSTYPSVPPSLSVQPSKAPSTSPSSSFYPSTYPSVPPSFSVQPSKAPSISPSLSSYPSSSPSVPPSLSLEPSMAPSASPSVSSYPSSSPSVPPSLSLGPSMAPSASPSVSSYPSESPSSPPSLSLEPSEMPSTSPSLSSHPSDSPSNPPSISQGPSNSPSVKPSASPSLTPTNEPSVNPSSSPSFSPSSRPSNIPSYSPSSSPTATVRFVQDGELTVTCPRGGIQSVCPPSSERFSNPISMTFSYVGYMTGIHQDVVAGRGHTVSTNRNSDGIEWEDVYVVAKNGRDEVNIGTVGLNETFTVTTTRDKLDHDTHIFIFSDSMSTEPLQEIQITCKTTISTQDRFGSLVLETVSLQNGGILGEMTLNEGDIVYSITGLDANSFRVDSITGVVEFIGFSTSAKTTFLATLVATSINEKACVESNTPIVYEIEVVDEISLCVDDRTNPPTSIDISVDCPEVDRDNPIDICKFKKTTGAKPATMIFVYDFQTGIDQIIDGDKHEVTTTENLPSPGNAIFDLVRIVASDDSAIIFDGIVSRGDAFEVPGSKDDGTFQTETIFDIYGVVNTEIVESRDNASSGGGGGGNRSNNINNNNLPLHFQTINIHTSCSDPTNVGDRFGSITLGGAIETNGEFVGQVTAGKKCITRSQLEYQLLGEDAIHFRVDNTGIVTFISPPNYNMPLDSNRDNEYIVIVRGRIPTSTTKFVDTKLIICVNPPPPPASAISTIPASPFYYRLVKINQSWRKTTNPKN